MSLWFLGNIKLFYTCLPRTMTPSMSKRNPNSTPSSSAAAEPEDDIARLWIALCVFGPEATALMRLARGRLAMRDMSASYSLCGLTSVSLVLHCQMLLALG